MNKKAKPNVWVYNTCLHGYAMRGMIYEVEALLEKLEQNDLNHEEGDENRLRPDVYSYSICLNAYEKFKGKNERYE